MLGPIISAAHANKPLFVGPLMLVISLGGFGCISTLSFGPGIGPVPIGGPTAPLTAADVTAVITAAAKSLNDRKLVIAVTDREGNILGLFRKNRAVTTTQALLAGRLAQVDTNELAVSLARTGAFFSNDQAPLSSRTVRMISREHFPPTFDANGAVTGVKNTAPGALWDIENTNKGCVLSTAYNAGMAIAPPMNVLRTGPGIGIATIPGGVPLYKGNKLVGGVGVTGTTPDLSEFAAISGAAGAGFVLSAIPPPGEIFIDGVRLPFIHDDFSEPVLTTLLEFDLRRPFGTAPDAFMNLAVVGAFVPIPLLTDTTMTIGGTQPSLRPNVPEGWLVGPIGSPQISASEVAAIVEQTVIQANITRAAIRLPLDQPAKMVISVSDLNGRIIGLFRMADATVFSIDVAATKSRNVAYLSSLKRSILDLPGVPLGTAVTNRTLRFGSQPFYPQGIDDTFPGPFAPLRVRNQNFPCSQGFRNPGGPNQSGIVFFPGSVPLYKFGVVLVGGLGVSGDGVDQDDIVSAAGGRFLEPAPHLRADNQTLLGARLPWLKFPRAPQDR
ncbi:MAG: heme-binding protein [Planctomycetota bacterium]|nr:heme-binding protein [Planctomycetota bacterium]